MKTVNIKNIKPCFFSDNVRKNSLFIELKHNNKIYFIEFSKNDLIIYFKNHILNFSNLIWFLNFHVLEKKGFTTNGNLFYFDNFISRLKENYNFDKKKMGLPNLI